jgi:hypothetical protein
MKSRLLLILALLPALQSDILLAEDTNFSSAAIPVPARQPNGDLQS